MDHPHTDDGRLRPGAIGPWLRQGLRGAFLLQPRWDGLQAHPAVATALVLASVLASVGLQRLLIDGPAIFYWQTLAMGWLPTAVTAWLCYLMRPQPAAQSSALWPTRAAPGAAHLFCLASAQNLVLSTLLLLLGVAQVRSGFYAGLSHAAAWALWLLPMAWTLAAMLVLYWRGGGYRHKAAWAAAVVVVLAVPALSQFAPAPRPWYADRSAEDTEEAPPRFELTQEATEAQPRLLATRLGELKRQRRGVVDLYAITFAPYADEDVFMRESGAVAGVMTDRFDARGRTIQLVNNAATVQQWPWATPLNLRRAIQRAAQLMDKDEDILFLHLTSHGARSGHLAADFEPLTVAQLTPQELKAMLDEAGIRWRVISISACFSGSWLQPLAGDGTLVMTAADADHTSYGCGRLSELTFFGRAMYDELLRTQTLSFEQAHAKARTVIKQREEEAGKEDGYSNPQISMGSAIRGRLDALQARLAKDAPVRR